jgi:N-acetylmuramyl-L-alanine amidase, negative regulator of AmpC, AmpD
LVKVLITHYPDLTAQNIVGHSQIAAGRKTDPGDSFNWEKLLSTLDGNKS